MAATTDRPVLRFSGCSICEAPFVIPIGADARVRTCAGSRCQVIRRAQNRRWSRKREQQVKRHRSGLRPYNDPEYRAARAWLTANPHVRCWYPDCDAQATTIDHVPALMDHHHVRGSRCCELRPACRPCNCGSGAAAGNRKREAHSPW
jgi:hypothetical protein